MWEATARKPGNVHRFGDLPNLTYWDLLAAAAAVAPVLAASVDRPLGHTIYDAICAAKSATSTNANLGIVLLLAPLCHLESEIDEQELRHALETTSIEDAQWVYQAIRYSGAGGLGQVEHQDVASEPTRPLIEVMRLAEDRDRIARQYSRCFEDVLNLGVPRLLEGIDRFESLEAGIVYCHLGLLAEFGDSLIARKYGMEWSEQVRNQAKAVLRDLNTDDRLGARSVSEFDIRLRERGMNPGTSADLVTASLFVALEQHKICLPLSIPWSSESRWQLRSGE